MRYLAMCLPYTSSIGVRTPLRMIRIAFINAYLREGEGYTSPDASPTEPLR